MDDAVTVTPERPAPTLVVEGISAGYQRTVVVHEVSVQVAVGEVAVIMGPNGAGKSTLIKGITGELALSTGRVLLGGNDVSHWREDKRAAAGIGYVPQTLDVFAPLTVAENLEMGGFTMSKRHTLERMEELYERFPQVRALRKRKARTLSGGERKLVGICRALIANPPILILDEPTANLAPVIAKTILHDVVAELAQSGRAILLIEQRVRLALEVATWGYVLRSGRLVHSSAGDELRATEDLGQFFLEQPKRAEGLAVDLPSLSG